MVLARDVVWKELARSCKELGKSYSQFRQGLSEMQAQLQVDDIDVTSNSSSYHSDDDYDDYEAPTAPKFEPPTSEPTTEAEEV